MSDVETAEVASLPLLWKMCEENGSSLSVGQQLRWFQQSEILSSIFVLGSADLFICDNYNGGLLGQGLCRRLLSNGRRGTRQALALDTSHYVMRVIWRLLNNHAN